MMFYHPEYIMYLWLIPVILSILLPLTVVPFILVAERMMAARKKLENKIYVPLGTTSTATVDNREHPRMPMEGISAFISDGTNCCPGTVDEISSEGIRLANPANIINKESDRLGVLINHNGRCYALQVKPQWQENTGQEENIGAKIIGGFWNWKEFNEALETERVLA